MAAVFLCVLFLCVLLIATEFFANTHVTANPLGPLVRPTEVITGTANRVRSGSVVWIVIRSVAVQRFSSSECFCRNGRWQKMVVRSRFWE